MPTASVDSAPRAAQHLRQATQQAHVAVEALPQQQQLAAGTLEVPGYVQVLQHHHRLLARFERDAGPWLRTLDGPDWHYRWRTPALARDLRQLGQVPVAPAPAPLPTVDVATDWGRLYVVEGALLGGRVIARQLRARQPVLEAALGYFELGAQAPGLWPRFQQRLDQALPDAAAHAAAARGAVEMFGYFQQQLGQQEPTS